MYSTFSSLKRRSAEAHAQAAVHLLQVLMLKTYSHTGGNAGAGSDSAVTWEDRKTQKACLERYRVASAEILAVFHEVAPDAIVEKASIDEAYLDVTSIVDAHLQVRACCLASHLTYAFGALEARRFQRLLCNIYSLPCMLSRSH